MMNDPREAVLVDYDRMVFDVQVPVPVATVAPLLTSAKWLRFETAPHRKRIPSIKVSVVAHKRMASYFVSQSRW